MYGKFGRQVTMAEKRPIREQYFIDAGLSLVGSGDGENVMQIFFNINIFEIISNVDIDVFCIIHHF